MSRPTKIVASILVLAVAGGSAVLYSRRASAGANGLPTVRVEPGTIIKKALAMGQIVPAQEIQVKSQISGIVATCFVEVGARVEAGQPLFAISPDPTPLELAEAERRVELAEAGVGRSEQPALRQADADVAAAAGGQPALVEGTRETGDLVPFAGFFAEDGGHASLLQALRKKSGVPKLPDFKARAIGCSAAFFCFSAASTAACAAASWSWAALSCTSAAASSSLA